MIDDSGEGSKRGLPLMISGEGDLRDGSQDPEVSFRRLRRYWVSLVRV
jgi:hypothetical protein